MARHNHNRNLRRPWRRLPVLTSTVLVGLLPSTAFAWSSSPISPAIARTRPLASTTEPVDDKYYGPSWSERLENPLLGTEDAGRAAAAAASGAGASAGPAPPSAPGAKLTLTRWLAAKVQDYPELRDMESLHLSIQMACKTISNLVHSAAYAADDRGGGAGAVPGDAGDDPDGGARPDPRGRSMKRLDRISTNVLQNALRCTGRLRVVEAPRDAGRADEEGPRTHQPGVTIAYALDQYEREGMWAGAGGTHRGAPGAGGDGDGGDARWSKTRRLAACFDPLDGSGNADAAICTGTVFGVFDADAGFQGGEAPDLRDPLSLSRAVLQPGSGLLAAGYCLYSSTTILVFTLGGGTHGFTLDKTLNEFVLTHPNMRIPARGNIYSCNEAYSEGWDDRFRGYLRRLKLGQGETGQRYTQRYVGSMVGDVHRTLMYGGIFCCPADADVHPKGNLQLVYKSAPMAYVLAHAGGKATDGRGDLLAVRPRHVHERSPCFMGSPEDMDELAACVAGEGGD